MKKKEEQVMVDPDQLKLPMPDDSIEIPIDAVNINLPEKVGRRLNTWNSYDIHVHATLEDYEPGTSMTNPNHTKSLKELLSMYTRGSDVVTLQPVYQLDGESDDFDTLLPDIEKMDALQKLEYRDQVRQFIRDTKKDLIAQGEQDGEEDDDTSLLELPKKLLTRLAEFMKSGDDQENDENPPNEGD